MGYEEVGSIPTNSAMFLKECPTCKAKYVWSISERVYGEYYVVEIYFECGGKALGFFPNDGYEEWNTACSKKKKT